MKVLLTPLIAAVLGLLATTLYLSRQLSSERQQTVAAREEIARLESIGATTVPAQRPSDAASAAANPIPQQSPSATASKTRFLSSSDPGAPSKEMMAEMERRARAAEEEQRRRLADPAHRALMRAARADIKRQQSYGLARELGLTDAQADQLFTVLAEQEIKREESRVGDYTTPSEAAQLATWNREHQELLAQFGAETVRRYDTYLAAYNERSTVLWFRGQLDAATMLTDDQVTRLASDMHDEKEQFDTERNAQLNITPGQPLRSINVAYMGELSSTASSLEGVQRQLEEQLTSYWKRMHDRAASPRPLTAPASPSCMPSARQARASPARSALDRAHGD